MYDRFALTGFSGLNWLQQCDQKYVDKPVTCLCVQNKAYKDFSGLLRKNLTGLF